jgi:hypothetical protein
MQRGSAAALAALIGIVSSQATAGGDTGRDPHRLYDRQTECAVFDTHGFEANAANWDGPCTHGLASGGGTATYIGRDGASQAVSATFRDGMIVDGPADIRWNDGAHYSGDAVDGAPSGKGVLVNAKGDRFEGAWHDGQLNGHGSVVWKNGDRYEGDWVGGQAEGHGVQIWSDGQKYDGAWHNDQPNGQGTVTRKDGTQFTAMFVDGKRQPEVAAAPSPPPPAQPAVANTAPAPAAASPAPATAPASLGNMIPQQLLDGMTGLTLTALDGSTVKLGTTEGGITRTLTAADGSVRTSVFTFLGTNLGMVADQSDPRHIDGMFHVSGGGVEIDYTDGHTELLRADPSGGLLVTLRSAIGATACASWYPQGHAFTVAERKAAVAAYAQRLGVSDNVPAVSGCTNAPSAAALPAARPSAHRTGPRHVAGAVPSVVAPAPKPGSSGLQTMPVKDSNVHLIDAPVAGPAAPPIVAAAPPPADEPIASNCLHVDSDGSYWGFRNHCGYSVQFAYCLLHGVNPMTACGDHGAAGVEGSVSADGFGALFADDSLGERDAEHQFRWVGCRGGAGEVIAQLDHAEPASGECVRTKTAQRDN